ncbi:MAG TPA: diguanylate cyclase [Nitrospiria bacterium]
MGMNVLIVDDSNSTRKEISRSLHRDPSLDSIFEAQGGLEAMRILADEKIDIVLTDLVMPAMDGFKLVKAIRSDQGLKDTPIVILSARSHLQDRIKGLELGAWDYLVRPVHPVELQARVRVMLRIKSLQDGLKTRLRQLERISVVDGLTGLYNKKYFNEFLRREANRSKRFGFKMSCIMMDVDHFKKINATHGHPQGDRILKALGGTLGGMIRGYDFAARFGGDEFALILPQQNDIHGAKELAERIRQKVKQHSFGRDRSGRAIHITLSMGAASLASMEAGGHEKLLEEAARALSMAKDHGRNCVMTI